jgi:hypothetical protein
MVKDRLYSCARRSNRVSCKAGAVCSKCSFFEVIRLRFRAFREQFGRDPGPNEPLFFEPDRDRPVQVDTAQAIEQIEAAARTLKIHSGPVLDFLKLKSTARNRQDQSKPKAALGARPISSNHPTAQGKRQPSEQTGANQVNPAQSDRRGLFVVADRPSKRGRQSGTISAWKRFVEEERTHNRHHVTNAEWAMLSKVAMMGEALNSPDFIFILNTIRQAARA